jgi:3-oxoisoapionate decarboxylase
VREYDEGFLLADVPLGQGFLELKKMVNILHKAQPKIRFTLELITRDPLKVPCLTDKYWATFATTPGRDLARTLLLVRRYQAKVVGSNSGGYPRIVNWK